MKLEQFLDGLRLNAYEKEAVMYLSSVDAADAKTIIRKAKIPQGRVYSVLDSLSQKGLVSVIPTKPKKYEIKDVNKALKQYLKVKKTELDEKICQVDDIEIKPKTFSIGAKDPSVNMLTGRDEHLQALISFRDNAKKEIIQVAPHFVGTFASNLSMYKALERGVNIKVIIHKVTPQNRKNVKKVISLGGEVRQLNSPDLLSMMIKDSSEFVLGVQDYHNSEQRLTLLSRNKALLKSLEQTFDSLWKQARPAKSKV